MKQFGTTCALALPLLHLVIREMGFKRAGKERERWRLPEELGKMPVSSQKINPEAIPEKG